MPAWIRKVIDFVLGLFRRKEPAAAVETATGLQSTPAPTAEAVQSFSVPLAPPPQPPASEVPEIIKALHFSKRGYSTKTRKGSRHRSKHQHIGNEKRIGFGNFQRTKAI